MRNYANNHIYANGHKPLIIHNMENTEMILLNNNYVNLKLRLLARMHIALLEDAAPSLANRKL